MGLGTPYIVYSKSNKSLDVVGGVLRVLDSPHTEAVSYTHLTLPTSDLV